jgi:hypothetical protein
MALAVFRMSALLRRVLVDQFSLARPGPALECFTTIGFAGLATHYPLLTLTSPQKSPMTPVVSMFRMPIGIQPDQQSSYATVRQSNT